jgi:hypothetical protein
VVQIGRGGERFEGVREIAVLRGGGLGDLMFAMPAIGVPSRVSRASG